MNKASILQDNFKVFLVVILAFSTFAVTPDVFAVEDETGIVQIFCNVINEITGGIGKVISILILISMAIGLFLGKITWGLAIATMVAMGLLFGASGLINVITKGVSSDNQEDICQSSNK
jgi:type IV secretion system protein VirB2